MWWSSRWGADEIAAWQKQGQLAAGAADVHTNTETVEETAEERSSRTASCKVLLAQLDASLALSTEACGAGVLADSLGAARQRLLAELASLDPEVKEDKRTPVAKAAALEGYIARERKRIEKKEAEFEDLRGKLVEQLMNLEAEAATFNQTARPELRKKMAELDALRADMALEPRVVPTPAPEGAEAAVENTSRESELWRHIALGKDASGKNLAAAARAHAEGGWLARRDEGSKEAAHTAHRGR